MPQNQDSGARANAWGHDTSRIIAARIAAKSISKTSNEFEMGGKRVTIRCARKATTDVGVTYAMLDRVESIIGAFENSDGSFSIYQISPSIFRANMRDSKNENKVGLVRKKVFQEMGKKLHPELHV